MIGTLRTPNRKSSRQLSLHGDLIAQDRPPLLNTRLHAELSLLGALAAQHNNLQTAGACLSGSREFSRSPNGLRGLDAGLSILFDSFAQLSRDAANLALRRTVMRNAQEVAAQFNRAHAKLEAVRNDLNGSIQNDVIEVNRDLGDVAAVNGQIMRAKSAGRRSITLLLWREEWLEALSSRVNIKVKRRDDGGVNITIAGQTMVAGAEIPDTLATWPDQRGNLRLQSQNTCLPLKVTAGRIAGKMAARDGGLAGLQHGLNTLASQLIARVNSIYNSGRTLNAGIEGNFFKGGGASDIGVNPAMAANPARLKVTGAAPALAKLGQRAVAGLGNRTFTQSYTQTISKLGHTLSRVNSSLVRSRAVKQMLANERTAGTRGSSGKKPAGMSGYRRACEVSARTIESLDKLAPIQ